MQPKDQLPGKSLLRDAALSAQLDPKESFERHQEKQSGSKDSRNCIEPESVKRSDPPSEEKLWKYCLGCSEVLKPSENESTILFFLLL